MNKKVYGPYPVEFMGPGVHAGIVGEVSPELVGKYVTLEVMGNAAIIAAISTLIAQGYTYHGGERWKPPIKSVENQYVTR